MQKKYYFCAVLCEYSMITDDIFLELHRILPRFADEQVYLITDQNVAHHCLPRFMEQNMC